MYVHHLFFIALSIFDVKTTNYLLTFYYPGKAAYGFGEEGLIR